MFCFEYSHVVILIVANVLYQNQLTIKKYSVFSFRCTGIIAKIITRKISDYLAHKFCYIVIYQLT